jgi:hypothetical protein
MEWTLRARGWGEPPTNKILQRKPTPRSNFCLLAPAQFIIRQGISDGVSMGGTPGGWHFGLPPGSVLSPGEMKSPRQISGWWLVWVRRQAAGHTHFHLYIGDCNVLKYCYFWLLAIFENFCSLRFDRTTYSCRLHCSSYPFEMTEWKWGLAVLTNKFKIISYFYHPSLSLSYHSWVQENVLKLLGIFLQQIFVSFVIVAFCKEYSEKKNIFWKKFFFGLQTNQHESSVVQLPMNDIVFLAETLFPVFPFDFLLLLKKMFFLFNDPS